LGRVDAEDLAVIRERQSGHAGAAADVEDARLATALTAPVEPPGQVQRRPSDDRAPLGQVVLIAQIVEVLVHRPLPHSPRVGRAAPRHRARPNTPPTCTGYAFARLSPTPRWPWRSRIWSSSGRSSSAP